MNKGIIEIKVKIESSELYIEGYQGQNLLELLQKNQVYISNICHRNGTCGKCKVKLLSGNLPITEADKRTLTKDELEQGIRLACKAVLGKECETTETDILNIEIIGKSEDEIVIEGIAVKEGKAENQIISDLEEIRIDEKSEQKKITEEKQVNAEFNHNITMEENHFIAIDIGTTTIAMALVDAETGKVCDTYTSLNHQRKFGADVISRIVASNSGKSEELKQLIEEDLWRGIYKLTNVESKSDRNAADRKVNDLKEAVDRKANDSKEDENKQYTDLETKLLINTEEQSKIPISRIIISGNTTMIHLLMGYSCQSLGKYPFISEHLEQTESTLKDCIRLNSEQDTLKNCIAANSEYCIVQSSTGLNSEHGISKNCIASHRNSICKTYGTIPVTILPGISAFVGGDIVADILTCPGFESEEICLLIDLGTNGEMVLGNKNKLLAASTAAGPAFEGGNIICGTASIPGSICQVKIQNQRPIVKTIKGVMPPTGICGTGLVSAIAQLKVNKLIDSQGTLKYPYNEKGYPLWTYENGEKIAFYQQDIREFQMAKSAIRAGIEVLMEEYGCKPEEIGRVYLAGGFGVNLSEDDAICTGILPEEFRGRIEPIGNGALQGAIHVGREKTEPIGNGVLQGAIDTKIKDIIERTKNISLAESKKFQENYLHFLDF